MAEIVFLAGQDFTINNLSGSGLAFFGDSGFGASIQVGSYNGRTYITNSAGTAQGPEVDNIKFIHTNSGTIGQVSSGTPLRNIPNYQATLNLRFNNDTPVKTQNIQIRGYDRSNINNAPSGVTLKAANLIHPNINQGVAGSGDTAWTTLSGSGSVLTLNSSPGSGGHWISGVDTISTQHDHFLALTVTPDSIGSKLFALYASMEYL